MADEVMTQPQARAAYDRWLDDPRVTFVDDQAEFETRCRALIRRRQRSVDSTLGPSTANRAECVHRTTRPP